MNEYMNKDFIKEKIAWYKLLFTVLVTLVVGSVGWFATNYSKAILFFVISDIIIFTGFSIGIIISIAKIRLFLRKLGEIKDV